MDWRRLVLLPPPTSPPPSPPTPGFTTITTFIVHLLLLRLRRLSPSRSHSLYRGLSFSSSSPASVNHSVSLSRLLAAFTRSLLGHDRECGVLVSLPPPPSSPPPPLPVARLSLSLLCMRFLRAIRVARLGSTWEIFGSYYAIRSPIEVRYLVN